MPLPNLNSVTLGGKSCSSLDDPSIGGHTVLHVPRVGLVVGRLPGIGHESGAGTRGETGADHLCFRPGPHRTGTGTSKAGNGQDVTDRRPRRYLCALWDG